jgi:hypothetical protein
MTSVKQNKGRLGVYAAVGALVVAAAVAGWHYFSGDKAPEQKAEVSGPARDSRGRTPEQKAVAIALAPVMMSYRGYLETESSKLFPDETPNNAALLGNRLASKVLIEGRNIEEAFSKKDGKPYIIEAKDLKNRGPNDKNHEVTLSIDPAKGEISHIVDKKLGPSFKIDPEKANKLREAVSPESIKQSFNTIAPAEGLVTVPSLAQLAAPVEAKQLPAAPAVRQIARRTGPMGLA